MAVTFLEPGMDATQDGSFFAGLNVGTGSTAAYDSSQSHDGPGSLKCAVTTSGQTASPFTFDGTVSDTGNCISAWFRFSTVTPATLTNFLMCLTSANGSGRMGLGINTSGTLNFANKGATLQANGTTTLVANTWYRISMSYTNATSSTWAAKVYINGVLEINANAATQGNTTAASIACISFGQNASSLGSFSTPGISTVWVDSMYIDNRTNLTDCGNISVTAKRPFSNGTTTGFSTQIGAGGSGYGSGHTPQVNERPLSVTNGWSVVAVAATTEEYNIESASAGDVDLTGATIVDYMGWVYTKALIAETAQIIVNNATSNISVTTSNAMFTKAAGSTTYPAGTGTDIGMVTSATATTVSLYEAGIIVAYIPAVMVVASGSPTLLMMGV